MRDLCASYGTLPFFTCDAVFSYCPRLLFVCDHRCLFQGAGESFTTMLNSNELVTASASYSRESWATLQDEHQRRTCYADLVLSFGEFTPAYPIRMLSGRFLLPEDKNKIVLAAQQASALFCSYQCEGHTVLVNGSAYEVVGVYQTDSPYAKLSIMGLTEAYVSSEGPFTHWPVTAAKGKEAQLAFSLCETLRCMGVSDASAAPVYRHRAWLFFALYVQIVLWSVLSCIRLWKQKGLHWHSGRLVLLHLPPGF